MLLGINSFNYKSFQTGKFYIDVYVVVQFSNQFHFSNSTVFAFLTITNYMNIFSNLN